MNPNRILSFLVPYLKTTSGVALTSSVLYNWMKRGSHKIISSKTNLCVDNLKLFLSLGFPETQLAQYAAKNGDLNLLKKLLVDYPQPWGHRVYCLAAQEGHLHILDWLLNRGYTCPQVTSAFAVRGGEIKVLEWLQEKRVPFLGLEAECAAAYGHLDVLEWLFENGYQLSEGIYHHAARSGHLHILEFAKRIGIPWNKQTWAFAKVGGHQEVLEWLEKNGILKIDF